LAVAKARLSLERQQTLKVLPRTLTPEQTTVELGEGMLINVQFTPPTGEIYMVLARPWAGVGTVFHKMDRDISDVLKFT
jgi:hypothetical protein